MKTVTALERAMGRISGWRALLVSALCGGAMALGQAPLSFPWLVFVAIPMLIWQLRAKHSVKAALGVGWAAGTGYFATALFWIVEPFLVDIARHGWMAPFALTFLAGGLALFWGLAFGITQRLASGRLSTLLILAVTWTGVEMLRSVIFTGFPWALPAYLWVETPLAQLAAVTGPHGLTLLTVLVAGAIALRGLLPATLAVVVLGTGWVWGVDRLDDTRQVDAEAPIIRLIQPNAAQHLKWLPEMIPVFYRRQIAATAAPGDPDLVIWPETAVPFLLNQRPNLQDEIARAAGPDTPVILGIRRQDADGNWFNSLAVLGEGGQVLAQYDKHHLVPFGEYVPFANVLSRFGVSGLAANVLAGFKGGPGPQILSVDGLPDFLPLVCYEVIFPSGVRVPEKRPGWLVQITNDAWFGQISGPYQHLAQAQMRAIEQGLPLARSANTGVSAMIDARGQVISALPLGEAGHIDVALPDALPPTPYARLGDWPVLAAFVLLLLGGLVSARRPD